MYKRTHILASAPRGAKKCRGGKNILSFGNLTFVTYLGRLEINRILYRNSEIVDTPNNLKKLDYLVLIPNNGKSEIGNRKAEIRFYILNVLPQNIYD